MTIEELLQALNAQNFGPNDSTIVSSARHPITAAKKLGTYISDLMNTGMGQPYSDDAFTYAPLDRSRLGAANEIASYAQVGSMPFAPKTRGGTLGTAALPDTEFSKAHKIAQQNAALPIEQGGLGLAPDNTAMDRAKALGFDIDNRVYHGTNSDIKEFDVNLSGSASGANQYGSGVYTTTNPSNASGYANPNKEGSNVMPLLVKLQNPINATDKGKLTKSQIKSIITKAPDLKDSLNNYDDVDYYGINRVLNNAVNSINKYQDDTLINNLHPIANDFFYGNDRVFNETLLKVLKKDGVKVDFDNEKFYIPFQEKNVRSIFAAFDPMKKNSSNILASTLMGMLMAREQEY